MKDKYSKTLLIAITFVVFLITPAVLFAAKDFVALQNNLPGITYEEDLGTFFNGLFQIGVISAAFLAVIFIGIGGVQYMTTKAPTGDKGKEGAKERITSALSGLFLVLLSVVLLNVINPDIVKFTLFTDFGGLSAVEGVKIGEPLNINKCNGTNKTTYIAKDGKCYVRGKGPVEDNGSKIDDVGDETYVDPSKCNGSPKLYVEKKDTLGVMRCYKK